MLGDEGGDVLTSKLVARALKLLVERDGPFYLTVWNGLTTIQQRVLTAAVKENGTALASHAVTERYGVSASTMSKALKFLENREVLRREELHNSMRWRLEDPFFAACLNR
jgi:DNA-binding MarR family transcriptional regulator